MMAVHTGTVGGMGGGSPAAQRRIAGGWAADGFTQWYAGFSPSPSERTDTPAASRTPWRNRQVSQPADSQGAKGIF